MRRKRLLTCLAAAVLACGITLPALAFVNTTTTSVSPTVVAQQLQDAITISVASASATSISISWASPSGQVPNAVYQVVRTTAPSKTVCTTATSPCTDTGLTTGTTYSYTIQTLHQVSSVQDNWQRAAITAGSAKPTVVCGLSLATSPTAGTTETAGTAFAMSITAQTPNAGGTACVTDTSYTGNHTITWSGGNTSPGGNAPALPAAGSVSFSAGVASSVTGFTLFAAGSNTLTATSSDATPRTGSQAVSVNPINITFATCPAATKKNTSHAWTVNRAKADAYGNVDPNASSSINVTMGQNLGSWATSPLSIAANASGDTNSNDNFTPPNTQPTAITVTASAAGYGTASCGFTTTP